ncbi:MAG: hypothetical protein JW731_13090 [Bacteroidales bacterium]|nr:hypothetical protein [Bacteroidales bacterium]
MKKKISIAIIAILMLLGNNQVVSQTDEMFQSDKLSTLWKTADILTTSESVCYEPERKVLFVSCINGNPTEKDGNGFIAMLSLNGDIISHKWVTGLNAPKGMGIYNGNLFVTDIDRVVELNIDKAALVKEYQVENAKFLNDITIDPVGNVYISDMVTNKIHRIYKGIVETWLDDNQLKGTNGLFYEDKEILAGTKSGIFSIRIEDKRIWQSVKINGGIDGLESDGKGNYIISDWSGKIQLVNPESEPVLLLNTTSEGINAADIEFIIDRDLLLVPTFSDNRVSAYELKEE